MAHTIKEISDSLDIPFEGDGSIKIESISSAISANPNQLVVAISKEYTADLANSNAKAALMFQGADWQSFGLRAALLPKHSKLKMSEIFNLYDKINEIKINVRRVKTAPDGFNQVTRNPPNTSPINPPTGTTFSKKGSVANCIAIKEQRPTRNKTPEPRTNDPRSSEKCNIGLRSRYRTFKIPSA